MPDPAGLAATALACVAAALLVARPLARVGFRPTDVVLLCAAPLATSVEFPVFGLAEAAIAVNVAGFVIPVVVCAKLLVARQAPPAATAFAVVLVTTVAYLSSYAVPGQGVLLRYQAPALAACGVALVLARTHFAHAGPVAFIAGTVGVVVGADVLRIPALVGGGPSTIIVGGAGVLDGIFLVGVLGAGFVSMTELVWTGVGWAARRAAARRPSASG